MRCETLLRSLNQHNKQPLLKNKNKQKPDILRVYNTMPFLHNVNRMLYISAVGVQSIPHLLDVHLWIMESKLVLGLGVAISCTYHKNC